MTTLAKRLEQLRSAKKMSRVELASALGLPTLTIDKFETGKLSPNKEQQAKIAEYFGVSVLYLKGESDDPTDMKSWLNGNFQSDDEPAPKPVYRAQQKNIVAKSENKGDNDSTVFDLLMKNDSFKNALKDAVLDVLRSPEGQQVLGNLIKKELTKK